MVTIEPSGGHLRTRTSSCRLAVSRFGLTSPPAPFRVGVAPTDNLLSPNWIGFATRNAARMAILSPCGRGRKIIGLAERSDAQPSVFRRGVSDVNAPLTSQI